MNLSNLPPGVTNRDIEAQVGHGRYRIRTNYEYPSVPFRDCDWSAVFEDSYEPGEPIGSGENEAAAIFNLLEQVTYTERDEPQTREPSPFSRDLGWSARFIWHERGDPVGHGPTEQAAIDDLMEQAE